MHHLVSEEFRRKAQARIFSQLKETAQASNAELQRIGETIRAACNARMIVGPIKDWERAAEKVENEYGGDWYDLKDGVRLTILVPDQASLKNVRAMVRATCAPRHGISLMKDYEATPQNTPCGYSGLNFVVRLSNGQPGEIQANVPVILFGNMKKDVFLNTLGLAEYSRYQALYQVEGSLGHGIYEVYRVAKAAPEGKEAAALGQAYFKYLRGAPNLFRGRDLQEKLTAFKRKHPSKFH